ncbi:MAG TPA: hypothetical protein VGH47_00100 [Xanthobacteraceae bacterium]
MEIFLAWLFFAVLTGVFAQVRRNRNGFGWFMLSLLISPLFAFPLVAILREPVARLGPAPGSVWQRAAALLIIFGGIIGIVLALNALPVPAQSQSGSTTQHDAPTTRYYTSDGRPAGSASTYGNTTKFYAPDGRLVGSATTNSERRK